MSKFVGNAHEALKTVGMEIDYSTLKNMSNKQIIQLLKMNKLPWRAGITKFTLEKRTKQRRFRNSLKGIKTT